MVHHDITAAVKSQVRLVWQGKAPTGLVSLPRPDIVASVNIPGDVTSASFNNQHLKAIIKTVKQALKEAHFGVSFQKPQSENMQIVAFSIAPFITIENGASQLGFIVIFVDCSGKVCILSFASRKSNRAVG